MSCRVDEGAVAGGPVLYVDGVDCAAGQLVRSLEVKLGSHDDREYQG